MLSLCVGTLELCTRALSSMLKHECNPVCEGPERSICTFGIWFCKLCALTSHNIGYMTTTAVCVCTLPREQGFPRKENKKVPPRTISSKNGVTLLWFLHVVLSGGAAGNRAGTRNSRCSASLLKIRGSHFSVSFSRAVGPGIVGTPKF